MKKQLSLAVLGLFAATAANAGVITFDGLAGTAIPGYQNLETTRMQGQTKIKPYTQMAKDTPIVLDGYSFTSTTLAYLTASEQRTPHNQPSDSAGNGTDFLAASNILIKSLGSATFSVSSLDLGMWTQSTTIGQTVSITGKKADGSTVSQNVLLTIRNRNQANDFVPVTMLDTFTGLTSLSILGPNSPFALDNVNLSDDPASVPEPASLAMVGIGLAGLALRRRRK